MGRVSIVYYTATFFFLRKGWLPVESGNGPSTGISQKSAEQTPFYEKFQSSGFPQSSGFGTVIFLRIEPKKNNSSGSGLNPLEMGHLPVDFPIQWGEKRAAERTLKESSSNFKNHLVEQVLIER